MNVSVDGFPVPPESFARADLVVTGHVTQMLPAQWATPDRKPPADPLAAVQGDPLHAIITPVVLTLDGPPVVDHVGFNPAQRTLVMAQPGGTVGRFTVTVGGSAISFQRGERMLVVLGRFAGPFVTTGLLPTDAGPAWAMGTTYLISANGDVDVNGTPVPEPDVIARMRAAGAATSTPTP